MCVCCECEGERVTAVLVWGEWVVSGWRVDERIGFGLYQSSGDRGSVGHVSVFWLRWCGWGVGRGLDRGRERWGGVMSV